MSKEEILLSITFNGEVPGLSNHRVSMEEFGKALVRLQDAVKWTASAIVGKAERQSYGKGGSPKQAAQGVGLELVGVRGNCATLDFVVTPPADPPQGSQKQIALFHDLHERAILELLDDLQKETEGIPTNHKGREFLLALPDDLGVQTYKVEKGGEVLRSLELGETSLEEAPISPGGLLHGYGQVVGVQFLPARPHIRISLVGGGSKTISATGNQVEKSLSLRNEMVAFLALAREDLSRPRLLWIRPADKNLPLADEEERADYIFKRWEETLRRLAE